MLSVLALAGNRDAAQRIALMERYSSVFEVSTIKLCPQIGTLMKGAGWVFATKKLRWSAESEQTRL
jgi:hypothetical protein